MLIRGETRIEVSASPRDCPGTLSKSTGTYVLLFRLQEESRIRVGKLGTVFFQRGVYAYVGSARGPGGFGARLKRHARRNKKPRWHIDYVTMRVGVEKAFLFPDHVEEAAVAELLGNSFEAVDGFGASDDSRNNSHLFLVGSDLDVALENLQRPFGSVQARLGSSYVSVSGETEQTLF